MDAITINAFVDLLVTTRPEEVRVKSFGLIGRLNCLTKELREAIVFAITERLTPNDTEILGALAPLRNRGTSLEIVVGRIEKIANAFGSHNNAFKDRPEIFDLVGAILLCLKGEPAGANPSNLAELAMLQIQALKTPSMKQPLAHWMYGARGHLSAPASQLLSPPTPPWLREKLDETIGDAKPRPITSRQVIGLIRDRAVMTWDEVRQGRPAAILGIVAITFSMLLFAVTMSAGSTKRETPAPAVAQTPTPLPTPAPATVYDNLTKAIKEQGSNLEGVKIMISPRARDDGDIQLCKAITSAGIKGITVVPPSITREVFNEDASRYSRAWLTPSSMIAIDPSIVTAATSADHSNKVYYVDLEFDGLDQGRVSVISVQDKPSVLLIVTGAAPGLKPAVRSQWFIDRALRLTGDPQSSTVALLLAQAKAAATTDLELAQVNLNLALVHVAGGRKVEAQKAAEDAWPWLSDADKERLPEPLRRAVELALPSLKVRVQAQVGLK